MDTKETFILKSKNTHGDKYDYSKVEYVNSTTKVCIICPEHGEFWQAPVSHIRGNGCPKCSNISRGRTKRSTKEEFIEKSNKVHYNMYDYSKVEYINANTKVCIICPKHGEFWQTPQNHLLGQGCPKCSGRGFTNNEIIAEFKKVHGNKYDYSKVDYKGGKVKVCIICPEHGEFWQTPQKHLSGQGCPKCRYVHDTPLISKNTFINRSKKVHGNKYDYSKVDFKTTHDKVTIICPKHGEFQQLAYDHMNGHGCPKCGNIFSHGEFEIYDFLCKKIGENNVKIHDRSVLDTKEIDIYIPSMKFGIEYNGLRWHSELMGKNKDYHITKLNECNENGVNLIQIFEDEYLNNKELVLNKLLHILKLCNLPKIMGRKCDVREIDNSLAKDFLIQNHVQGYSNTSISIGAFYCGILVGVMCFTKTNHSNEWVLSRFATDYKFTCQGVGGKLFNYFVKNYSPTLVKSFADRRWTTNSENNLYTKLGFKLTKTLKPEYRYIDKNDAKKRIHKFNLRKKGLHKKYGLPLTMTESEMCEKLEYYKIWDCGLYKYEWKKEAEE